MTPIGQFVREFRDNKAAATRAVWDCIFNGGKRGRVPELWDGKAAERVADHLVPWLAAERLRPRS